MNKNPIDDAKLGMPLSPAPNYALVQVQRLKSGLTAEKERFGTNTRGLLLDAFVVGDDELKERIGSWLNKEVIMSPYSDGDPITIDGKDYVLVSVNELRGVVNA